MGRGYTGANTDLGLQQVFRTLEGIAVRIFLQRQLDVHEIHGMHGVHERHLTGRGDHIC